MKINLKIIKALFYSLFIITAIQISACKKEPVQVITPMPPPDANHPPVVNAGVDITIVLPIDSVLLSGTASSSSGGTITSYQWTKINGPAQSNINTPDKAVTTVTNLVEGTYSFRLAVFDSHGQSGYDTINIFVNRSGTISMPPCSPIPANNANPFLGSTYIGNMSEGRSDMAITFSNNKIFMAGGYNACSLSNALDIVDVNTSTVSSGQLSLARYGIGATASGDKIFFAGGLTSSVWNSPTDVIDIYDITTATLSATSLSVPRGFIAAASVGDVVLFAGGTTGYPGASSRIDIYNTVTKTWTKYELSEARYNMAVAVVGNKVVFAGGRTATSFSKAVDIYDYSTNTWTINQLSRPRYELKAGVLNNKIYFAGGENDIVEVLDMDTNKWSTLLLSESKSYIAIATSNNKIAFIGGAIGYLYNEDYSKKIEIYDPATTTWSYQFMKINVFGESVITIDNNIYSAGGYSENGGYLNGIFRFSL